MARLICDISISLDGFVAGPNPSLEEPLGEGGELLHEWAFAAASWRESHGLEGGEKNADSDVIEESLRATGAVVMGRRMFSGGDGHVRFALVENEQRIAQAVRGIRSALPC